MDHFVDRSGLFCLINGKSSLQKIVNDWIEKYRANRDSGLLALMQLFISASGCLGTITHELKNNVDNARIIGFMARMFDKGIGLKPSIISGPECPHWQNFRSNFCDFLHTLVKQCQHSIIYDKYLMDNVISFLITLSESKVRVFRHTATLAVMKLVTALVDVALTLSDRLDNRPVPWSLDTSWILDNTSCQHEVELQKTQEELVHGCLEELLAKFQGLEKEMGDIKDWLTYTFKAVFVHRYEDVAPEIRALCIDEIGIWMKRFPGHFLDDFHLKYVGWTLNDAVADVRKICLQALQPLYATEEHKGKLKLFTSKFKERVVSMTQDVEYHVAVQAVRLIKSIHKYHREILSDKDCGAVYVLVFSSHQALAQAAGKFLNERLFTLDDTSPPALHTHRGKKRLPNTPLIRDLVQFVIESEMPNHEAYLVDSLIDSNEMMKDWECMTDLLMEHPGPGEKLLDDQQETVLIELMTCCIKQATTKESPVGREPTRKKTTAKETKQAQDDRVRLTEHFIQTLPLLLGKYIADPDKVANLLLIPQYFDIEIYTSSRQEMSLESLLRLMPNIVEIHTETKVLENYAKLLQVLCTEDRAIYSRCDVIRSTLIDRLVNKLRKVLDDHVTAGDEEPPKKDEVFTLVSILKKVAVLSLYHDLGLWNLWDPLFNAVRKAKDLSRSMPPEATKHCISACYSAILWELQQPENGSRRGTSASQLQKQLIDRLDAYILLMKRLVNSSNVALVRDQAFISMCDLLIAFFKKLGDDPLLRSVVNKHDRYLQPILKHFIQNRVFVEDKENDKETKIKELNKRRNYLSAYCKLFVYNVLPIRIASGVFRHYVKYYNDYGDIIKMTLEKALENNKLTCARAMCRSLAMLFSDLTRDAESRINRQSKEFQSVKDLAIKFAIFLGSDASMSGREAIYSLHQGAIDFAITFQNTNPPTVLPANLAFLEICAEFTNNLHQQDRKVCLRYLDQELTEERLSRRGRDWEPMFLYRNSLLHPKLQNIAWSV